MRNTAIIETLSAAILIALVVLLVNPYHVWMPSMVHVMAVTALLIVFCIFAGLILREQARDEREGTHRMYAGRNAFLVGSLILIVGIGYQSLMHSLDLWLPVVLVGMILAKIGTHFYNDRYR